MFRRLRYETLSYAFLSNNLEPVHDNCSERIGDC